MNQEIDKMTRPTCFRLLVLPLLLALAACGSRMSAEERLDLARTQLAEGDVPTASIHLRNVLQADPTNVEARILLAEAAFRYGDFDSAAKEYQRAVDLGADAEEFRAKLVESLVRAGSAQDALRYADPGVVGDDPEFAYWRAIALARTGRTDEAIALLESLRDAPEWGDRAQVALARVALGNQRPEEALAMLEPLEARMAAIPISGKFAASPRCRPAAPISPSRRSTRRSRWWWIRSASASSCSSPARPRRCWRPGNWTRPARWPPRCIPQPTATRWRTT
jgi:thioredoxin-like negative regulator of GroEL